MSIAFRFHLFDAIEVIATFTLSLEQVGDSVLKLSTFLKPLAHGLAFVEHFSSTSICLSTQSTDIVGWHLFSFSSNSFSDLQLQDFEVNLGDIRLAYQDFVSGISIISFFY